MADAEIKPKGVVLNKQTRTLQVEWTDGMMSLFPLDALREACPCAGCRGGHMFMGRAHDPNILELKPLKHYEIVDIQMVGNYALQLLWDDGHQSGIYSWEYLRRITPGQPDA